MFAVGLDVSLNLVTLYSPLVYLPVRIATFSTQQVKEILFGSLLGDGQLEMSRRSINARFGFIQSVIHMDYFLYLYNILSHLCGSPFNVYNYLDARTGKTYTSYKFWTLSSLMITELYGLFYIAGVKVVPQDLTLLTALALAH